MDLFNSVVTHCYRWSAIWGRSKARHNALQRPAESVHLRRQIALHRCQFLHCDLCASPALTSGQPPTSEPSRTESQHTEPQKPVKLASLVLRAIQNSPGAHKTIKKTRKNSQNCFFITRNIILRKRASTLIYIKHK